MSEREDMFFDNSAVISYHTVITENGDFIFEWLQQR